MTKNDELSKCPRCGKTFHCSKSGKCWCYEVALPLEKLEEIENTFDSCLCPSCLQEYAKPPKPQDGKYTRTSFIYAKKERPS